MFSTAAVKSIGGGNHWYGKQPPASDSWGEACWARNDPRGPDQSLRHGSTSSAGGWVHIPYKQKNRRGATKGSVVRLPEEADRTRFGRPPDGGGNSRGDFNPVLRVPKPPPNTYNNMYGRTMAYSRNEYPSYNRMPVSAGTEENKRNDNRNKNNKKFNKKNTTVNERKQSIDGMAMIELEKIFKEYLYPDVEQHVNEGCKSVSIIVGKKKKIKNKKYIKKSSENVARAIQEIVPAKAKVNKNTAPNGEHFFNQPYFEQVLDVTRTTKNYMIGGKVKGVKNVHVPKITTGYWTTPNVQKIQALQDLRDASTNVRNVGLPYEVSSHVWDSRTYRNPRPRSASSGSRTNYMPPILSDVEHDYAFVAEVIVNDRPNIIVETVTDDNDDDVLEPTQEPVTPSVPDQVNTSSDVGGDSLPSLDNSHAPTDELWCSACGTTGREHTDFLIQESPDLKQQPEKLRKLLGNYMKENFEFARWRC